MTQGLSGKNQLKVSHKHFFRVQSCLMCLRIIWVNFMKRKAQFLNLSKI